MVLIEKNIKNIPRREIDALEELLDKMLKKQGHFDYSSEEWIDKNWKPIAGISFVYNQGKTEAVTLVGEGTDKKGNFDIQINLNLSADTYNILKKTLEKQAPILVKSLPTLSYSS